jgi:hypothetical protein
MQASATAFFDLVHSTIAAYVAQAEHNREEIERLEALGGGDSTALRARAEAAERRVAEAGGDVAEIEASIAARDAYDSTRADSPLREADGSMLVDTTGVPVDDVIDRITALLQEGTVGP